ncbi:hypothetical protein [uncultured Rhodoferax sp.]|uniref:hypothetical protein n=1 Tax=uncultured Rhodoferax sp. TaxID=223188 RepID=UPI0025FF842D|nr:hypothetical protein [uncultured Rhodoferax sp.]
MSTETEARQQLAAAITAREDATDRVTGHLAALARANALVGELESEVHRGNAHAAANAAQTAAALADQLLQGAELAIASPTKASAEMREAAVTRLTVATTARDQLQRETKQLEDNLAHAVAVVRKHALAVLRLEGERLAVGILQQEKNLWAQRNVLRGIAFAEYSLAATDASKERLDVPALLTVQAQQAMQPAPEPQYAGGQDPAKDCAGQWKQFYDALIEDAQVRFFA